jgi:2-C-methyl-D-erythritol 4-phosphate cytidylyltransferase
MIVHDPGRPTLRRRLVLFNLPDAQGERAAIPATKALRERVTDTRVRLIAPADSCAERLSC